MSANRGNELFVYKSVLYRHAVEIKNKKKERSAEKGRSYRLLLHCSMFFVIAPKFHFQKLKTFQNNRSSGFFLTAHLQCCVSHALTVISKPLNTTSAEK